MDKITGLMNIGNTCFMNASLQLLFKCSDFVNIILNTEYDDNNMIKYKKTLEDYYNTTTKNMGPVILYKRYQKINENYKGFTPEDAHEYLTFIIDDIFELTKNEDIKKIFQIKIKSSVSCLLCNSSSSSDINENILSLCTDECKNIDDCIKKFIKAEELDHKNRWFCDKCKCLVNSVKKMDIIKLPKYLFISLDKNNLLDLSLKFGDYNLIGIIFHIGNTNGGHYFTGLKKGATTADAGVAAQKDATTADAVVAAQKDAATANAVVAAQNADEWIIVDDINIETKCVDKMNYLFKQSYILLYEKN